MFGLFKNNAMSRLQQPGMAQNAMPSANPRQTSQTGWDMFSQRNPEGAAQIQPMLPQGMFNQNPMQGFQVKDPNQSRHLTDGGGQMHALPVVGQGQAGFMGQPHQVPQANPFTQYSRRDNLARYGG